MIQSTLVVVVVGVGRSYYCIIPCEIKAGARAVHVKLQQQREVEGKEFGPDVGPKSRFKAVGCEQAMETPCYKKKRQ